MQSLKLVNRKLMLFSPPNCPIRFSSVAISANRQRQDASLLCRPGTLSYVGGCVFDRATFSTTTTVTFAEGLY